MTNRILVPQYAWRVSELIDWTAPASGSTDNGKTWILNTSTGKYEPTTTLTNYTLVTPTIASTGWANANHAHTGSTSGGQLDHGNALTGLGDNDHPQYFLASGVSGFGATLIDDADATAARSTLGLGTMATATESAYPLLTGTRPFTGAQTFSGGVVTATVRPASDSINAIVIKDASGSTDLMSFDTVAGIVTTGKTSAPNGMVLLQAKYDGTPAQTLFTEHSTGAIGLGQYMYQDGSSTWLSAYAYGALGRSALIVGPTSCKFLLAPAQNVAVGSALTSQPTTIFSSDSGGMEITGTLRAIGTVRADGLRLDVTPTAETPTATHTITISANGTNYKLLCVAA